MSKLRSNMIYQSVYEVLAVCIPLITSPYLSRVLGAEGLGIYSYNHSIISYFMLISLLGVVSYGMRTIAKSRGKEEISKNFWSIYSFQLITSGISIGLYVAFILFFVKDDIGKIVSWIHIFYLIGECVNINWLFFGLEKYKLTVLRNIAIKVLTVASIFIFVREKSDVIAYVFILAFCNFLSNAVLLLKLKSCVKKVKISWSDVKEHIKPNILLFIPVLSASVYHVMDKTMLGMLSNATESGYYYNADKLLNIPLVVVVGCGNVFMSRVSSLMKDNDEAGIQKTQNESVFFGMWLISAIAFGISAVSKEFVPWFFGKGYEPCISLIKYFAAIVVIKTLAAHTRSAFLIPEGKDKAYAKAVTYGALINLVINYVFIAKLNMGALGATLATLLAEFVVLMFQLLSMGRTKSRRFCIKGIFMSGIYLVIGFVMLLVINLVPINISGIFVKLVIKIALGGIVYLALCAVLWKFKPSLMPDMVGETVTSFKKKLLRK